MRPFPVARIARIPAASTRGAPAAMLPRRIGRRVHERWRVADAETIGAVALPGNVADTPAAQAHPGGAPPPRAFAWTKEPEDAGVVVRDHVHGAGAGLGSRAPEERAAIARGHVHRVLQADRCEDALVVGGQQARLEGLGFLAGDKYGLMSSTAEGVLDVRRRAWSGSGCVGQLCSSSISLFGTARSSIGQIGFAGHPVEHVEPACLRGRDDDVAIASVVADSRELRRCARDRDPINRDERSGSARAACRSRASSATTDVPKRLLPIRSAP